MGEEQTFWANQSRWPRDTNDYVFLCRAVFQVGKALYPDDWADTNKLNTVTKGPNERFKSAKSRLFEALANGAVIYCLRPTLGGEFSYPCPAAWWNTERWGVRFVFGQMNPKEPFSTAFAGDKFQWIFIKADSLQAFLKSLNPAPQTTIGAEARCKSDLIAAMLKSPTMKPKSKGQFMVEMMEAYDVSERGFIRAWSGAIRQTGATWDRPGRLRQLA